MKTSTVEFLKQCFSAYYSKGTINPPPSLSEREWGFIRFDSSGEVRMRRHIGFCSRQELDEYIRSIVPSHIYYSSAYYQTPGAPTMDAKKWTGADLIFDLDADHLMRGPYSVMLSRVKEETGKLLDMLTDELGFSSKSIDVVFSGGRGYHIHIRDPAVRSFGSSERRELIDYVCGTGIDPGAMLGGVRSSSPRGWRCRYISSMIDYLAWLQGLPVEEALAGLEALPGIGELAAGRFLGAAPELSRKLTEGIPLSQNDRVIWPVVSELSALQDGPLVNRLKERAALADEPVTTDVKRLIRLPTSLHGGSGFRVTPLSPGELAEFDPLIDAVVFGTRDIQVDLTIPLSMDLLGCTYHLEKGISTVPEALAVFLCCRGVADLAGGG
ncbi:MAG TPA: DNA primase small subunit PriS [Methanoregulaceae archaeon]|nr:DNA primase small subunit PriS [Methanoregulaceae archaeon]